MSKSVKVPKEVMELVYEEQACLELSEAHSEGFFPSLKAIYYKSRAVKANVLVNRALASVYPQVKEGDWTIDIATGLAIKSISLSDLPPKKTRKPRASKIVPAPLTESN